MKGYIKRQMLKKNNILLILKFCRELMTSCRIFLNQVSFCSITVFDFAHIIKIFGNTIKVIHSNINDKTIVLLTPSHQFSIKIFRV